MNIELQIDRTMRGIGGTLFRLSQLLHPRYKGVVSLEEIRHNLAIGENSVIQISLKELILIGVHTDKLLPQEFKDLMKAREEDPKDLVGFAAVADWCLEHDEPDLYEAFLWLTRHPEVEIRQHKHYNDDTDGWDLYHLPKAIEGTYFHNSTQMSLAYRIAALADQIKQVKAQL